MPMYAGEAFKFIEGQANKLLNSVVWKAMMEHSVETANRNTIWWIKKAHHVKERENLTVVLLRGQPTKPT